MNQFSDAYKRQLGSMFLTPRVLTLLSLVAPRIVVMTTKIVASNDNVCVTTTLGFQSKTLNDFPQFGEYWKTKGSFHCYKVPVGIPGWLLGYITLYFNSDFNFFMFTQWQHFFNHFLYCIAVKSYVMAIEYFKHHIILKLNITTINKVRMLRLRHRNLGWIIGFSSNFQRIQRNSVGFW